MITKYYQIVRWNSLRTGTLLNKDWGHSHQFKKKVYKKKFIEIFTHEMIVSPHKISLMMYAYHH